MRGSWSADDGWMGEMCGVMEPCRAQVSTEMSRENPRAVSEEMRGSRSADDGWSGSEEGEAESMAGALIK
ncbi:hypothetical protein NDU88_001775 [Pleurodeles waltl]|uniref:Uncharacterized protein n=1 Tax=Pleurodeles waltl TaxID=8319 RepID=A0AAV7VZW4_PLEWA|nr:hypothetical protein NDU88_001775 [Pleurodeles waltl]